MENEFRGLFSKEFYQEYRNACLWQEKYIILFYLLILILPPLIFSWKTIAVFALVVVLVPVIGYSSLLIIGRLRQIPLPVSYLAIIAIGSYIFYQLNLIVPYISGVLVGIVLWFFFVGHLALRRGNPFSDICDRIRWYFNTGASFETTLSREFYAIAATSFDRGHDIISPFRYHYYLKSFYTNPVYKKAKEYLIADLKKIAKENREFSWGTLTLVDGEIMIIPARKFRESGISKISKKYSE